MVLLTRGRILWVLANIIAAIAMPVVMSWWIERLVSTGEGALPEGFAPSRLVFFFTLAWLVFLLLLNIAMALFVWLTHHAPDRG